MNELFKNYKVISLGYNCFIKKYMNDNNIKQETNLYDYIGVSMWSINELLLNDFSNLYDINDYKKYKIFTNDSYITIINERYYLRFPHEFKNKENKKLYYYSSTTNNNKYSYKLVGCRKIDQNDLMKRLKYNFKDFCETLKRRITRFKTILSTEKKILFMRLEEETKERIIYDKFKDKFIKTELDNILEFSNIIKNQYPNLNFKIIYISKLHESSIIDNVIILKNNFDNLIWDNCTESFNKIFNDNKNLLN